MRFNEAANSTSGASVVSVLFSVLLCYLLNTVTDCHENFGYYGQDYVKELLQFF